MKPIRLALFLLLAAGATGPTPTEDARKRFDEGRSDEALALLQKASRENPENSALRTEYYRMRDVVIAQWLSQAESLRQAQRFDAAETLYRRALSHDATNPRATAGLAQIETDRRHAVLAAQAEQLVRAGKFREAQDVLRPVLTENPQQKEARRLQRVIDDSWCRRIVSAHSSRRVPNRTRSSCATSPCATSSRRCSAPPASTSSSIATCARPAHHHPAARRHRGRSMVPSPARSSRRCWATTPCSSSEHAEEAAQYQELVVRASPRQRRRETDRQHDPHAGEGARHLHRREDQPAGDQGHARGDPPRRAADRGAGPAEPQ
jgi:tetratricopeptide (TPR) repeat protein